MSCWNRKEENHKRNQERLQEMSYLVWLLHSFSVCVLYSVQFFGCPWAGMQEGIKLGVRLAPLMLSCRHKEPVAPPACWFFLIH